MKIFLSLFCFILCCVSCDQSTTPVHKVPENHPSKAQLELDTLFNLLGSEGQFNGVVHIYQKGQSIFKRAIGYADIQNNIPLNLKSRFDIQSIEKSVTALAVMVLIDRDSLHLDQLASTILPDFPYPEVTINHLLSHSSGIPETGRDAARFESDYWDSIPEIQFHHVYEFMTLYKPLPNFMPGKSFRYSNSNFDLLRMIISKVHGKSLNETLTDLLFEPLNISPIGYDTSQLVKGHEFSYETYDYTSDYDSNGHNFAQEKLPRNIKRRYYNADDFIAIHKALKQNTLFSEELKNKMFTEFIPEDSSMNSYGLGWGIITDPEFGLKAFHFGGGEGFISYYAHYPDDDLSIIILSNKFTNGASGLHDLIENILYERPYNLPKKSLAETLRRQLGKQDLSSLLEDLEKNLDDTITYVYNERHVLKIGQALTNSRTWADGMLIFNKVLDLNPNSVYAHNFIGEWHMFNQKLDEAESYFKRTLTLEPSNKFAIESLKTIQELRSKANK